MFWKQKFIDGGGAADQTSTYSRRDTLCFILRFVDIPYFILTWTTVFAYITYTLTHIFVHTQTYLCFLKDWRTVITSLVHRDLFVFNFNITTFLI